MPTVTLRYRTDIHVERYRIDTDADSHVGI